MKILKAIVPGATLGFAVLFSALAYGSDAIIPSPPKLAAEGYLLIDADSGKVLVEFNSRQRLPPASLTKMMTSYIAATELERGTIKLNDQVRVSEDAWKLEGSRLFPMDWLWYQEHGTSAALKDVLYGVVVSSGNDAASALATHIAGSEDTFADMMNQHAVRLGMRDTNFINATGLPHENHYTTAEDLAKLTVALIKDFPEHYKIYKEKYFTYANERTRNRNVLLWRDPSVDGVKTGHTEAAGYCLVASAERDDMRLISVVMGTNSEESRATESQKLLSYGFRYFESLHLYDAGDALKTVRVWGGERGSVDVTVAEDVVVTIPRGGKKNLEASMDLGTVIKAPLTLGQELGRLLVVLDGETLADVPLSADAAIEPAGFFKRIWDAIVLFFVGLFGGDTLAL